jgi:inosine/xanthosine triphosphate pyrophosphatase family protein
MKLVDLLESKKEIILVSSNKNKIKEFKEMIPQLKIENGKDLPEVQSDMNNVILYKALDAGKGYIVEDTILEVNGIEVVDIRWKKSTLSEGDKVRWIVSLGYNDGQNISVYRGIINGKITLERENSEAFGFDDYVIPHGTDKTLFELGNDKNKFSARRLALENFKKNKKEFVKKIKEIKAWTGSYQH